MKICGITSEADALLCISFGADAVSSCSPRRLARVSVQTAGDVVKRLPPEILTVGVFRDEAPQRVVDMVHQAGLGAAQLHGHESAEETKWVRARLPMVIKAFPAGDRTIERFEEFGADYLLIDGPNPGSGEGVRLAPGRRRGRSDPAHRRGRPAPGQRGSGCGAAAASGGRRCVDRRGSRTRPQGPTVGSGSS